MASATLKDTVGQRDRLSIDFSDWKQEIEDCRSDPAWKELTMTAKVRVLVRERLDQIKQSKQ